jgi:hypothetical protein
MTQLLRQDFWSSNFIFMTHQFHLITEIGL